MQFTVVTNCYRENVVLYEIYTGLVCEITDMHIYIYIYIHVYIYIFIYLFS